MMNAEIISVGTELLLGQITNTDARFIAERLSAYGVGVFRHTTVGDNAARLTAAIGEAYARCDTVVFTGGLGPTADDLTKETVAAWFGLELVPHAPSMERLNELFARRGRPMTPNNLKQAYFPAENCLVLPNERGTAPGCIIEKDGKAAIILPGPPYELTDMFIKQVEPWLARRSGERIYSRQIRLFGIGESECEQRLKDLMEAANPSLAPYAGFGEVKLRFTVRCGRDDDAEALIAPLLGQVRERVGEFIYSEDDEPLQSVTAKLLVERGLTVAAAESLTGGMVCSWLVDWPGVSAALLMGVTAYSNEAKRSVLGVRAETLAAHGAVSAETAMEMAEGARRISGADVAVSTTGIAGPGGAVPGKPVGTVYVGYADSRGARAEKLLISGDRERVRTISALNALNIIRKGLLERDDGRN